MHRWCRLCRGSGILDRVEVNVHRVRSLLLEYLLELALDRKVKPRLLAEIADVRARCLNALGYRRARVKKADHTDLVPLPL